MHLPVAITEHHVWIGLGLFCIFVFDTHNELATTHRCRGVGGFTEPSHLDWVF